MINNFQVEIIRQFEIQKASMQNLLDQYLLDESDASDTDSWEESEIYVDKYLVETGTA